MESPYQNLWKYAVGGIVGIAVHVTGYLLLTGAGLSWPVAIATIALGMGLILGIYFLAAGESRGERMLFNAAGLFCGILFPNAWAPLLFCKQPPDAGRDTSYETLAAFCFPQIAFYLAMLVPWPEGVVMVPSVCLALIVLTVQVCGLGLAPMEAQAPPRAPVRPSGSKTRI